MKIFENKITKYCRSENYNYNFNKKTGYFARWGKTFDDDPEYGPLEIADIEISTVCNGIGKTMESRRSCSWCYKSNTVIGEHMSFDTFKKIFHKLPRSLVQIALGLGNVGTDENPDLWRILDYCKNNDYNEVIGNLTTNGMGITNEIAEKLAIHCGAVAVSRYHIPDVCYNAVEKITKAGLKQCNIHMLLARDTYEDCFKLIDDVKSDNRLKDLNAIVFLSLKEKGLRNKYKYLDSVDDFIKLFSYAIKNDISIGMDSCTQPIALKALEKLNMLEAIKSTEGCESMLFSVYCDVRGNIWPCSFMENIPGIESINILNVSDFNNDIWFNKNTIKWRNSLIKSSQSCTLCSLRSECRSCPVYPITPCHSNQIK